MLLLLELKGPHILLRRAHNDEIVEMDTVQSGKTQRRRREPSRQGWMLGEAAVGDSSRSRTRAEITGRRRQQTRDKNDENSE